MKLLIFILFFVPICLIPCDWEVINYEPETYIYYITPMNETELVSYSYDGEGNIFYQYSSDNGSTWEVIREEKFVKFEHQPEQIREVIKVNQNTILFFRFVSQILSYNIKTKKWDSTYSEINGDPILNRSYFIDNDKIIVYRIGRNDDNIEVVQLNMADTTNPLDFTVKQLFENEDPRNSPFLQNFGIFNGKLYYWLYKDDTILDTIGVFDIYNLGTDKIVLKNQIKKVDKIYFYNDNLYFTNFDFIENKSINNGFYKYNSETQEAELLYKFDHNYYGEPYLSLLSDSTYSLIINGVYYLFENDVFIKKHLPVQIDCPECEASKKSLVYNKYNGYYYYTTNGFCLFRSADYLDDILSSVNTNTESNGVNQKSFIVKDNHFEYQINADEIVLSTSLFNINGQKMNAEYDIGLANMINLSMPVDLIKGVYILRIVTNKNDYEIKLMKQ